MRKVGRSDLLIMEWPLVNERKVLLKFGQELTKETWDMRLLHQNFNAVHAPCDDNDNDNDADAGVTTLALPVQSTGELKSHLK